MYLDIAKPKLYLKIAALGQFENNQISNKAVLIVKSSKFYLPEFQKCFTGVGRESGRASNVQLPLKMVQKLYLVWNPRLLNG